MRVWIKQKKRIYVVEMCVPFDKNVGKREKGKEEKYQPLRAELEAEAEWGVKAVGVTLVVGAMGMVMGMEEELKKIVDVKSDVKFVVGRMQRAAMCGTVKAINKFKTMV